MSLSLNRLKNHFLHQVVPFSLVATLLACPLAQARIVPSGAAVGVGTGSEVGDGDEGSASTLSLGLWGDVSGNDDYGLTVLPAYYAGFDFTNRIINLAPATYGEKGQSVALDDTHAGFRVMQARKLSLGVGAQAAVYLKDAAIRFGGFVGVIPMYGRAVYYDRYVARLEDIKKMSIYTLPFTAEALAAWRPSDNVTFLTEGGLIFTAGVGYYGLSVGASYLARGEWTTYVEKLPNNAVYVRIGRRKLNSLMTSADATVAQVGVENFGQNDHNFSFAFDLNNPAAAQAYAQTVRGNIQAAQALVQQNNGVRAVTTGTMASTGRLRTWMYGIPFITMRRGAAGRIYSLSDTLSHESGAKTVANIGLYLRDSWAQGLVTYKTRRLNHFTGISATTTYPDGRQTRDEYGVFQWGYERTSLADERLENEIHKLGLVTGLVNELAYDAPDANLGYARARFVAKIPAPSLRTLMSVAMANSKGESAEQLSLVSHALVMNYVQQGGAQVACGLKAQADEKATQKCIERLDDEAQSHVTAMQKYLVAMANTEENDPAAFARSFAKFGREMTSNPFAFQTVLATTPVEMKLIVEGRRIQRTERIIHWNVPAVAYSIAH